MIDFTTASREERRTVYDAIAKELGDDRFFTSKELDVLPRILSSMEQVLSFSSGLMDGNTWLIVLTDQRVLFVDKGMLFGLKQTSIELDNIVSIKGQTGLMFGNIEIADAGSPHEIRNVWKSTVNPFVNRVRQAMGARRRGERLVSPGWCPPGDAVQDPDPSPTGISASADQPAPAITPSPQPTATPMATAVEPSEMQARLERLLRLHAAGAIDDHGLAAGRRDLAG